MSSLVFAETDIEYALVTNPTLTGVTLLSNGIISMTEFDDFLKFRAWDYNLRGYKVYTPTWSLMVELEYTKLNFFPTATHVGCEMGTRCSMGDVGLSGWSAIPFVLIGYTSISSGNYDLSRWGVMGVGGEIDRTFVWNHFLLDIGIGIYSTRNVFYRSVAGALEGSTVSQPTVSVRPSLHTGVGYAF